MKIVLSSSDNGKIYIGDILTHKSKVVFRFIEDEQAMVVKIPGTNINEKYFLRDLQNGDVLSDFASMADLKSYVYTYFFEQATDTSYEPVSVAANGQSTVLVPHNLGVKPRYFTIDAVNDAAAQDSFRPDLDNTTDKFLAIKYANTIAGNGNLLYIYKAEV